LITIIMCLSSFSPLGWFIAFLLLLHQAQITDRGWRCDKQTSRQAEGGENLDAWVMNVWSRLKRSKKSYLAPSFGSTGTPFGLSWWEKNKG